MVSNCHKLLRSKGRGGERYGQKAWHLITSSGDEGGECKRTADDASKMYTDGIKTGVATLTREKHGGYLLTGHACVKKTSNRHAVREMKVGPSKPPCRRRLQTALSCYGPKAAVVNVRVKRRGVRSRQVGIGETNASEPPMTHRK